MIWCGITQDRTQLFTTGNLHRSLWYFDPQREEQLQAALVAEYNCIRDLCRTDESLQAVGEYLHVHPYYILPAFGSRLDWTFSNSAIQHPHREPERIAEKPRHLEAQRQRISPGQ